MEIFVGNLPFDITEQDILDAFSKHGSVAGIKMLNDRITGKFRGIAFVTMDDETQGNAAIEALNNVEMGGRPMRVDRSRERTQRFSGFGGGFRENRGGSGGGGAGRGGFGGGRPGGFNRGGGDRGGFNRGGFKGNRSGGGFRDNRGGSDGFKPRHDFDGASSGGEE